MKRNGLLLTMTFLLLCACHPSTQDSISPTNPTPRPTQIQQTIIQIIEQQEYDTIHWISKEDIQNFISLNPSFIEECYLLLNRFMGRKKLSLTHIKFINNIG